MITSYLTKVTNKHGYTGQRDDAHSRWDRAGGVRFHHATQYNLKLMNYF